MKLNLRQVEAFRAVMVSGSITNAAEMMCVTQPAVSRLISDFEFAIGFKLFDRARRKLIPTPECLALFEEVKRTFAGMEHIRRAAEAIGNMQTGHLSVVAMSVTSTGFLPGVIASFSKAYPEISVSLWTWPRDQALEWIVSQQYDLGVITIPVADQSVIVEPFTETDAVCILPNGHRLADKKVITAKDLDGEEFVPLTSGSRFRHVVDQIFENHEAKPVMRVEARSAASICSLVERGLGVSIVGRLALYGRHNDLIIKPFMPSIPFKAGLVYPSQRPLSEKARIFGDHAIKLAAEMAENT